VEDPEETFPGEQPPELAPGQTVEGAQSTLMICEEMMGGLGSPGVEQFYGEADATGSSGSPFAWVLQEGNPNLTSETADTWTFGLVANMANVTLAMDWYKVEIEDAIASFEAELSDLQDTYGLTDVDALVTNHDAEDRWADVARWREIEDNLDIARAALNLFDYDPDDAAAAKAGDVGESSRNARGAFGESGDVGSTA
jgi:outer membrane receptor protein involved in Fe transport